MKRITILSILLAACMISTSAKAVPVPTGQANEIIVNFDFTGQTPAPIYSYAMLYFTVLDASFDQQIAIDVYGGLNGAGLEQTIVTAFAPGTTGFTLPSFASVLDGVFSVGVYMQAGSLDLGAVGADEYDASLNHVKITHDLAGSAVPEPGTFALLFGGLGLLGFVRRRKA